jgi:outer membrane lipoprotein-sorting protein
MVMDKYAKQGGMPPWKVIAWLVAGFALLILPARSLGAEFTARLVVKDAGKTVSGKLSVKGDNLRQEFMDRNGHSITIVRRDKKLVWVVMPREKVYIELPLEGKLPGQFLQLPANAIHTRRVGIETVNGYTTERYQLTVPGGPAGSTIQTYWISEKLGTPLKMECKEKNLSVEYQDINEGQVADNLFEPPTEFKKVTRPTGLL